MTTNEGSKLKARSFRMDDNTIEQLSFLVDHYQKDSIVKLTQTDVLRHLILEKYNELSNK